MYNEAPHTKINSESPNEQLRKMIEYGHNKEKKTAELFFFGKELEDIIISFSMMNEGETEKVLSYIIREAKQRRNNKTI